MAPRITDSADSPATVDPAPEYVPARWVDVQPVFVPGQGLVCYGDPISVSVEQLASPAHTTIPWADDWTPDPALIAQSQKVG
jgi:hypothetical protein